ncbi:DNA-binding SARP family transcriptional activator [Nocardiopsis arvandica]|uniref:DNA-binding SARP family transcriptional activator n=1 Tax=Nocardiopsis sinuspersici TaxID=501010 RepID=A0A7Z0BKS4_9ACTN|nr:AfsR/SARP family transcriptional regulator [Nocardiopsis sinuspersici]NYH55143.1 DNA-binding SARP family transcriptional activator [Nocardiopsis sinuspersici]
MGEATETAEAEVAFGVLGPVEAVGAHGPLDLRGPRHRAVLARLLAAEGRVVPLDRLVADLWPEPPDGAVAAVRTFVFALRRSLEPGRAAREPARLLVTAPPGYALRTAPETVDAQRFEADLERAGALLARGRSHQALAALEEALTLWRGPAYAELTAHPWARAEADRLEGLRLLAVERRFEALLELGRAQETVPALQAHTRDHPLREDAWRQLALALYRSGRQGDALLSLRRARQTLVEELGVDPGPGLRRLEADILDQAPHLTPRTPATTRADTHQETVPALPGPAPHPLVGRDRELESLERAAASAAPRTAARVALVSGEAGAGKTALAHTLTQRLAAAGWTTAWGRCPEHEGAPRAWPWTQIATALTATAGSDTAATGAAGSAAPSADPAAARFHALREAVRLLATATERAPVLLVLDDLHRAGPETLDLVTALTSEALPGPALLVGTYRTGEVHPALTAALARLAPREPARIYVGGLPEIATDTLVRALAGHDVHTRDLHTIHRRSGGNPFFARELARLLAAEGSTALDTVPAGVRDVIRHRLDALPPPARRLLRQAAVIGREVDTEVLAALSPGEEELLDALDAALRAGFLTEQDDPAHRDGTHPLRFAHALVRDTLYEDISRPRRAHWHTAAAEAIEALHPDRAAWLAHHFGRAGTRATAARAAHHARRAALQAQERFAPHEAARLWREAVTAHARSGETDQRLHLEAVMGMVRALAVTGRLEQARHHRAQAVTAAEDVGDADLTAQVITAFDVPAVWTRNDDEEMARRIAGAAERTLAALPRTHREQRGRLLATLALELRATPEGRGRRAARQAEEIARDLDDPALLALALNARFMHSFERAGLAPRRVEIGEELVDLAARHHLVTFQVLGHLVLLQAHGALADLAAADAHAEAADQLGARYELPLVGVLTRWYRALRMSAAGRVDEAEAAYRTASTRLAGAGMPGVEQGILPLALLCLRVRGAEPVPVDLRQDWGPYAPWARALARPGAHDEPVPQAPPGLLQEALTCLAARAATAAGHRDAMERAYRQLLPARGELAGAGSGLLTLGPVAQHLGDLARTLGHRDRAAEHYRQALRVADGAGAPHWTADARGALEDLG